MESKHLTDSEIQDYLDGNSGNEKSRISEHIESCSFCKGQLEQYRDLYAALEDDHGIDLSVGFAERVVSSAIRSESNGFLQRHADILLVITGIIATLVAILYFTDTAKAISDASVSGWLNSLPNSEIFAAMRNRTAAATGVFSLAVASALTLVTIWIVDRFMMRSKQKPSSFII